MNATNRYIDEAKRHARSQPKYAYTCAKKALDDARIHKSKYGQGQAYFYMAYACRVMSDYSGALSNALEALAIFEALDDESGIMKVRNITGIIYFYYGDYASAMENFMLAMELSDKVNDPNMHSSVINNMGEIYREAKDNDKALTSYMEALQITLSQGEDQQLELNAASIYLNIGEIHYVQKDFSISLDYIKKALDLAMKHNNPMLIGEAETKLGRAMIEQHHYQKAKRHYEQARDCFEAIDNTFYKIELLMNMAELADRLGDDPLVYLEEALHDARMLGLDSKVRDVYQVLSNYYEQQGNYREALENYKYYSMKEKEIEASNLSQKLEILSIELEHNKSKKDRRHIREITRRLRKDIIHTTQELEEIKQKNKQLMQESMVDELTQTFNRRGIQRRYMEMIARDEEGKQHIAAFMIDIDYFKAYNDSLGHIQGDVCLKKVGDVLKNIPCSDFFVGRFGGEEFLVIAKVESMKDAKSLAEHIRQLIENMHLLYDVEGKVAHLTISVGAEVVQGCHDMLEVIERADKALYKAKQSGRNCVYFYGKENKCVKNAVCVQERP